MSERRTLTEVTEFLIIRGLHIAGCRVALHSVLMSHETCCVLFSLTIFPFAMPWTCFVLQRYSLQLATCLNRSGRFRSNGEDEAQKAIDDNFGNLSQVYGSPFLPLLQP